LDFDQILINSILKMGKEENEANEAEAKRHQTMMNLMMKTQEDSANQEVVL